MSKYYTEQEMDYQVKISLALIRKFKDQLNAEYGIDPEDISKMFRTLYEEQNAIMPDKWYNYCLGKG